MAASTNIPELLRCNIPSQVCELAYALVGCSDPTKAYAHSQTRPYPVPGYGAPLSSSVGAAASHPPQGRVAPLRPLPLGPNSRPPQRPYGPAPPSALPALSLGLQRAASGPSPTMHLVSSVSLKMIDMPIRVKCLVLWVCAMHRDKCRQCCLLLCMGIHLSPYHTV